MPIGGQTRVDPTNHVSDEVVIPHGKRQFWELSGSLKNIGSKCFVALCGKKINIGDSETAGGQLSP